MKKAIILCSLDGYANSIKPREIKLVLDAHGYETQIYSTVAIGRLGNSGIKKLIPKLGFNYFQLYFLEALRFLVSSQKNIHIKRNINSLVIKDILELRGKILYKELSKRKLDLLICENNYDEAIALHRVAKIQILDLPTPFAEELFYGCEITEKQSGVLGNYEKKIYSKADYLSFHWYTYTDFVKKHKYNGTNFIRLDFGTSARQVHAHYSNKPRIVFLGYLGGYWSNTPLLHELSKLYTIDVYGGPKIPGLDLNYMGHTKTSDVLANYQFGLITITDDPLRQMGFSAKHVEYLSYGLPVLVPEWRNDSLLGEGSISYTVSNFLSRIQEYSDEKKWDEKSKNALNISENLHWDKVLEPLVQIINTLPV